MINDFISQRIASLRLSRRISARKLSVDLGQGRNYINNIENKQSKISTDGLAAICDYFEISLSEFFDSKTEYPLQYRELIEELNKLDTIELQKTLDAIKELINNKK